MCDQRKNSQPVTCPLRSRSHWLNFAGDSANCPATEKAWRTAAALTVRSPTRRSVFYGRPVFVPEGWKTGCLSGGPQVFRLSLSVKGGREMATTLTRPKIDVKSLDPYAFMAVLGKRVIHPGGRRSTEELFNLARLQAGQRALDVGCGVGTTAIQMAGRFGASVTAIDISPIMLERARPNVQRVGLGREIEVEQGDILALRFGDSTFDRVIAEAVTMFVDRQRAAKELVRVCRPGGMVLATEFFWRQPPTEEAREIFLGQVCPGMQLDKLDGWVRIYKDAGLSAIEVRSGPFEMMTPRGFIQDEGVINAFACMFRGLSRVAYLRKMAWLMPRISRAVPYLGYILVGGLKPATS